MRAVDVHQHLFPPGFVDLLRSRRTAPRIEGSELVLAEGSFPFDRRDHDVEARLALLDRLGTDLAVLSLQPTLGLDSLPSAEWAELVAAWEGGVLELVAASGGRLAALAAGAPREGFVGACVGSAGRLDLHALEHTLATLERSGGFLFVHPAGGQVTAGTPGWWGALTLYPAQMQSAYLSWLDEGQPRWPTVPVVFAILAGGGPFQLERLASRGVDVRSILHPNVLFDTASYGRRALELCIETFGIEQLVFGSDLPVVDPEPTLRAVQGFGESVEKLVRCDNPGRLLR